MISDDEGQVLQDSTYASYQTVHLLQQLHVASGPCWSPLLDSKVVSHFLHLETTPTLCTATTSSTSTSSSSSCLILISLGCLVENLELYMVYIVQRVLIKYLKVYMYICVKIVGLSLYQLNLIKSSSFKRGLTIIFGRGAQ